MDREAWWAAVHEVTKGQTRLTDWTELIPCCCSCSVTQSCPTLSDLVDCSSPGFPDLHYHPKFAKKSSPLSWWCYPIILCTTFSTCPQPFPASGSFPMSWLLASGGQSIGASDSPSVLPVHIQGSFPWGWTGLLSLQSKGHSRVFSRAHISKAPFLQCSAFFIVQLSHSYMTTGKTIVLNRWTFVGKVMSLLFVFN